METSKMKREATINRMAVQMGNLTHDDLASRVVAMIIECEGRVNRIQETMELVLEAHRQCILIHHLGKDRLEHIKRGGTYELAVPIARVQTDTPLVDYDEVSVYLSEQDGSWWVRPNTEMGDGRFKIVESRPAPESPPLITFEQLQSYMERAHNPVAWQDISTAPRDGTKILMRGGAYHGVPFPGYWNPSSFAPDRPWVSVVNDSRLYEHVPTHWMPLPAAPAKQEG